jgi:hypothetical protein
MTIRFASPTLAIMRKGLMERGRTVSTLLSQVLAGKRPTAITAMLDAKPGLRPEEVLRLALDQLETRRKLIDAGDDAFGRCEICSADLGEASLGEMPWADRCRLHPTVLSAT